MSEGPRRGAGVEVGELLEHFRYRDDARVAASLADPNEHRAVAHELADCLWLVCGWPTSSAWTSRRLEEKVGLAELKYPQHLAFGRPDKYTAYQGAAGETPPKPNPPRGLTPWYEGVGAGRIVRSRGPGKSPCPFAEMRRR